MERVIAKPIGELSLLRKILSKLPFFCKYCGKMYVGCHSEKINLFLPAPQNGKCCPDGHEGYTDEFYGYGTVRWHFDNVKSED